MATPFNPFRESLSNSQKCGGSHIPDGATCRVGSVSKAQKDYTSGKYDVKDFKRIAAKEGKKHGLSTDQIRKAAQDLKLAKNLGFDFANRTYTNAVQQARAANAQ